MHSITRRLVRGALRASLVTPAALAAQEEGSVIRRLGPATSSVEGRNNDDQPFAEDTNYDDLTFSWGGGGGLLIPVHRSRETMVFLDVGARYHNNGRNVRYLREGGIRDLPNGGIELSVIESRADLVTWHIGVSIGGR